MGKITSTIELRQYILELEKKQTDQWLILKQEAGEFYEDLKPFAILKKTLNKLATPDGMMEGVINSLVGYIFGLFSKKAIVGNSENTFKKIIGTVLQAIITNVIIQNPEIVKAIQTWVMDILSGKKETQPTES